MEGLGPRLPEYCGEPQPKRRNTLESHCFRHSMAASRGHESIIWAYALIGPQVLFFLAFTVYPIVMSYVYSFYEWSGFGPLENFIGWDNFIKLVHEQAFWNAFRNSLIYMTAKTVILLPTTLMLALVLNQALFKGKVFYRTIYFYQL